jgi:hypothetical protein
VTPTAVCSHVSQALDVVLDYAPGVVFYRHGGELGREGRDGLAGQRFESGEGMYAVLGEDPGGGLRPEGVEALESFL